MKAFCEHHQPWFRCGVCQQAFNDALAASVAPFYRYPVRDLASFHLRRLAGMVRLPWLGVRVLG